MYKQEEEECNIKERDPLRDKSDISKFYVSYILLKSFCIKNQCKSFLYSSSSAINYFNNNMRTAKRLSRTRKLWIRKNSPTGPEKM